MSFAVSGPDVRRRSLPVAVVAALVVVFVGIGAGLLWRVVAPRVEIIRVDQGFIYANAEPEQAVAADGWFGLLGLVAGLLVAILAWVLLSRHRGLPVLIGLVLGSLVGAWLGWWLGVWLDEHAFRAAAQAAEVGTHLQAPLSLGITGLDHDHLWPPKLTGMVVAQALAAGVVYTSLAGFSSDPLLRPASQRPVSDVTDPYAPIWQPPVTEPHPGAGPASSGPGGSAGPTGWPAPPGSA